MEAGYGAALGRLRQDNHHEFEASLGFSEMLSQKTKDKKVFHGRRQFTEERQTCQGPSARITLERLSLDWEFCTIYSQAPGKYQLLFSQLPSPGELSQVPACAARNEVEEVHKLRLLSTALSHGTP